MKTLEIVRTCLLGVIALFILIGVFGICSVGGKLSNLEYIGYTADRIQECQEETKKDLDILALQLELQLAKDTDGSIQWEAEAIPYFLKFLTENSFSYDNWCEIRSLLLSEKDPDVFIPAVEKIILNATLENEDMMQPATITGIKQNALTEFQRLWLNSTH